MLFGAVGKEVDVVNHICFLLFRILPCILFAISLQADVVKHICLCSWFNHE